MKMKTVGQILAFAMCISLCSCVSVNSFNRVRQCDLDGSCLSPGGSVRSELYFGLRKPDGSSVTEAEWQDFLDKSITPRFPDGLTVFDAYGQYKDSEGKTIREKTKVLVIVHTDEKDDDLDKICEEYKKAFLQENVFRTSSRVSSSLDDENYGCGND
jgi:hypothetical protein